MHRLRQLTTNHPVGFPGPGPRMHTCYDSTPPTPHAYDSLILVADSLVNKARERPSPSLRSMCENACTPTATRTLYPYGNHLVMHRRYAGAKTFCSRTWAPLAQKPWIWRPDRLAAATGGSGWRIRVVRKCRRRRLLGSSSDDERTRLHVGGERPTWNGDHARYIPRNS